MSKQASVGNGIGSPANNSIVASIPSRDTRGRFLAHSVLASNERSDDKRPVYVPLERTREMHAILKEFGQWASKKGDRTFAQHYARAVEILRGRSYGAADIEVFSKEQRTKPTLSDRYGHGIERAHNLGIIISAMINTSPDTEFVIHIDQLKSPITGVGYRLTKKLTVNGPANRPGDELDGGALTINGNVHFMSVVIRRGVLNLNGKIEGMYTDHSANPQDSLNDGDLAFLYPQNCKVLQNGRPLFENGRWIDSRNVSTGAQAKTQDLVSV